MIDFHTHILPNIDDGSSSVEETKKLFRALLQQGVDKLMATPHFYANHQSVDRFIEKRGKSLHQVRNALTDIDTAPEYRVGAEVYYFPNMGRASMLPKLCIEDSSLIMVELPFVQWTSDIYKDLEEIIVKQKLTIVLAHIERYFAFQKDKTIWNEVMQLPLYTQINTGSLLKMRPRRMCLQFLKEGYPVVLGTDCHNMTTRKPDMEEARAVIEKKLGQAALETIDNRGRELWKHD